jgi:hypothetical protein
MLVNPSMDAKFISKTSLYPAFSNTLRCSDRVWFQSLQKVQRRKFEKLQSRFKKNTEFNADFKTDEKVAKKFT